MVVSHLPYGPTAYFGVFNTVLRHDIGQKKEVGTISEAYPHLIFDKLTSQLGGRLTNVLKHLFPVPKPDAKRVVTFANADDYISFRHHTYSAPRGAKSIELTEVRPSARAPCNACMHALSVSARCICWGCTAQTRQQPDDVLFPAASVCAHACAAPRRAAVRAAL